MEKEFVKNVFEKMMRIRMFDMWMHRSIERGDAPFVGIMHSHVGEEGYAVAVISQLEKQDYISTTYRNHAHSIARGISLKGLAAEVCGKKDGVCKGRAGNMHAVDQDLNIIAGFGIIGAGLPATVGTAFASKYMQTDPISVAFFGDGAVAQGAFHESLNLAATLELPVLFVNNNNHYAMSTPMRHALAAETTTAYAAAHGMPAEQSCGMDFFKAYDAAQKAIQYVRETKKPYFIEFDCYRFHGQWEGDEQLYKDADEANYYAQHDPVLLFKKGAEERGLLSVEEIERIEADVQRQVEEAMEFAVSCEEPGLEDIMTDIYADVY